MEINKRRESLVKTYLNLEQAINIFIDERTQANEITKKGYRTVLNMFMERLGKNHADIKNQNK